MTHSDFIRPASVRREFRASVAALAVVVGGSAVASSTVGSPTILDRYQRAEKFLPLSPASSVPNTAIRVRWSGRHTYWFLDEGTGGDKFIAVDVVTGRRGELPLEALSAAAGEQGFSKLEFTFDREARIDFDPDPTGTWRIRFSAGHYTCSGEPLKCASLQHPVTRADLVSENGVWRASMSADGLAVRNEATQADKTVPHPAPDVRWAVEPGSSTSGVSQTLRPMAPVALWSPDSRTLLSYTLDERAVREQHLVQNVPASGDETKVYSYKYPFACDAELAQIKLAFVDPQTARTTYAALPPLPIAFRSPISLSDIWWSPDSKRVYLLDYDRSVTHVALRSIDPTSGAVKTLVEESSEQVNELSETIGTRAPVDVLENSGEVLWLSQRDGWRHLYRYDRSGKLLNQVTRGEFVVRTIAHVDEKDGRVYFVAGGREKGRDPYYRHLYSVRLDGSELRLLTPEDADHDVAFSDDGAYFSDSYSRVDLPTVAVVRDRNGKKLAEVAHADVAILGVLNWRPAERFTVKARDGKTDLYGVLIYPTHFNPSRHYPLAHLIYPGPQINIVPKRFEDPFSFLGMGAQSVAELGMVVMTVDGFGKPLRSRDFAMVSYGNLGDAGIPDSVTTIQQLGKTHPWLDLSRVGIYGESGGGFAAARAILTRPDIFKAAFAAAGPHDQRRYVAGWGNRYQGCPKDAAKVAERFSNANNLLLASQLRGKLMLTHGDMDDNVHPQHTYALADALEKAGKPFELLIIPNGDHGAAMSSPAATRALWDFFTVNLLGEEPPAEFHFGGDPAR